MYPGSIFNLYIKPRNSTDDSKWVTIQLKVIDDNYDDGIDFSTPNQIIPLESRRKNRFHRHNYHLLLLIEL
jgi:hypothetical protein